MSNFTNPLRSLSSQLADAVEQVAKSVVLVDGRVRQPASGIAIATDMILTADHVLERDDDLRIIDMDGRELLTHLVGRDPATDLALLQVPDAGLTPATPATELPRVGHLLLAVGRPSRGGPMASLGVVSAVGGPVRTRRGTLIEHLIQTDATPYPGFSGGALVDTAGTFLGMLTTGLIRGVPIGVPAPQAWQIARTLQQHGTMKRGYLGIGSQPVAIPEGQRSNQAVERGLLIVAITPQSPAAAAGVLLGDILIGFDGQPVQDTEDLQGLLASQNVGAVVTLDVLRGGGVRQIHATIGTRD